MALQVYEKIKHEPDALDFIRRAIIAAIKEYRTIWTLRDGPRRDPITGLTRYRPDGVGIPPETEASHFHHILQPYADKHNMTFEEFQVAYNDGKVQNQNSMNISCMIVLFVNQDMIRLTDLKGFVQICDG